MQHEDVSAKKMKTSKRIRLGVIVALAFLTVWGSVKIVQNLMIESDKKVAIADLEQQLQHELEKNKAYKQQIENLKDKEYREQQARKQNMMAKPTDTPFILPD